MDDFRELYRQIEYLRNNGIKMKEIADCAGMAPSTGMVASAGTENSS